jgi:hypothetical protein
MKLKRYKDCLNELSQVLYRLDPKNVKAMYRKAQVYELTGKNEEAMEVIDLYFENQKGGTIDTNFDKVFNSLKVSVIKKQETDKVKSKEMAQKMMNNTD